VLVEQALPQHGVGGLGQCMALARAEHLVPAEEVRDHDVGGHVELAHLAQEIGGEVEERVRVHGGGDPIGSLRWPRGAWPVGTE
jgi:hypothetical protein